jgi:hypothetical protein
MLHLWVFWKSELWISLFLVPLSNLGSIIITE